MLAKTLCAQLQPVGQTQPVHPAFLDDAINAKLASANDHHWIHSVLGQTTQKPAVVEMQSNDYLSIANDLRISRAKADYLLSNGHGDSISRIFAHDRRDNHAQFEKRVADLLQAEDAVLVMSGYNANIGLVQAFADSNTPVYIDMMAHASLWEGILCAKAKARPFRHNKPADLERKIKRYGPGLVIVDSLYSTNGNMCPLEQIVDVAELGGCAIVVDETHAFGCHGVDGSGLVTELGLSSRVHFRTMGLSKAIAARGGMVAGSRKSMEYFRYEARPMIFSTAVLGYEIEGFNTALDIIAQEPWRRQHLKRNHQFLKTGLLSLGYDVTASDSQIVSIVTGNIENTVLFREYLERYGVIGSVFCPPATPPNGSLIRFTVNASLTKSMLRHTLDVCASAIQDINMKGWPCMRQ